MSFQDRIREGMEVRTVEDRKVGKVVRCQADDFVIEKGLLFKKDHTAPYSLVSDVRDDVIFLAITEVDWDRGTYLPTDQRTPAVSRGPGADQEATLAALERPAAEQAGLTPGAGPGVTRQTRIPLVEEELEVRKVARPAGEVEVRKEVVTENKTVEVPVRREEVRVERVPVDRPLGEGEAAFQGGTTRVPIEEEEVEISKRPVVREEVRVTREQHQEQRAASAEVRRETAEVTPAPGNDLKKT